MTQWRKLGLYSYLASFVSFTFTYINLANLSMQLSTRQTWLFTCNIDYVIREAILFIWLHTHHPFTAPLSPPQSAVLEWHIGTATQTTAHLLQLLPRGEDNNQLNTATYGKPPADSNPEITGANFGAAVRAHQNFQTQHSILFIYFHKNEKTDEKKDVFPTIIN